MLPVAARRWVLAVNTFWHARWDLGQRKADDETSAGTNTMLVLPTEPSALGLHEGYYEPFRERFDPANRLKSSSPHGRLGFNGDLMNSGHIGCTNPNGADVQIQCLGMIQSRYLQSPDKFGSGEAHDQQTDA